jgi:hypothetical protein
MLYKQTVSSFLFKTLKQLMSFEILDDFRLVGGTALALQLGHRQSVDIDLFTPEYPLNVEIRTFLRHQYPKAEIRSSNFSIVLYIPYKDEQDLKVDLMSNEKFIRPCMEKDNIRFCHIEEIAAMKLEAITSRKEKKDFWDIYQILNHYNFTQLIDFYKERYPWNDIRDVIENAGKIEYCNNQPDVYTFEKLTWNTVKNQFLIKLQQYINKELM